MATTLTLTPNLSGGVAQALNDRNPFYIAQDGLDMPVVSYDEEYAESIYMEGGRRTRSREQNPEGKVTLHLTGGLSGSQVRTYLDQLEQTVQACRVYGGVIALALEGTTTVYYDIESISLSTLGVADFQFERVSVELSVTTRPYGRLAPVSLVSNATSSDPIQSVSLANIPGSAPALVQATVTDTATQARDHLEIGLDADYDPSTRTNLVTNPSFETNTTGWSTSVPAYHLNSGAVLSRVTPTVAQSGSYVGQIVTPGSAAAEGVAYAFSGYTFLAGTAYTLSMRVMASASTNVDLILGKASADHTKTDPTLAAGVWTDISVTWTPAANGTAVYAILRTDLGGAAVARTIQFDKVMVEAASSAGTYIEGVEGTTVYDYEAANGVATYYRARALHSYSGIYAASAWTTANATWSSASWWIKHPNQPALNLAVVPYGLDTITRGVRQGVFEVAGRSLPVVVSDSVRSGATGTVTFLLESGADRDALAALLDTCDTLLLQGRDADYWDDRYVRFGEHSSARVADKAYVADTVETLPWTEVDSPAGVVEDWSA